MRKGLAKWAGIASLVGLVFLERIGRELNEQASRPDRPPVEKQRPKKSDLEPSQEETSQQLIIPVPEPRVEIPMFIPLNYDEGQYDGLKEFTVSVPRDIAESSDDSLVALLFAAKQAHDEGDD